MAHSQMQHFQTEVSQMVLSSMAQLSQETR